MGHHKEPVYLHDEEQHFSNRVWGDDGPIDLPVRIEFDSADRGRAGAYSRRRSIYNPIYHFHERLSMLTGMDTDIPAVEFNEIARVLAPVRRDLSHKSRQTIQKALHELNSTFATKYWTKKWLERWPQIAARLNPSIELPLISHRDMVKLDRMFSGVVCAWNKIKKGKYAKRRHMPHFSYMMLQLLRMRGYDQKEIGKWLPQLTTKEKMIQTERYWKSICKEMGWPFIRLNTEIKSIKKVKK